MTQSPIHTHHLHILGQVQGVGFRPYVWRQARAYGLVGWVNNTTDGVHVVFNAETEVANTFVQVLLDQAPALSKITAHRLELLEIQEFTGFDIVHSSGEAMPNLLLTPDFGLCADCRRELHDPANRRYRYPFITCTNCGPRFSIATGLPYDRERTTMQPFSQCPECAREYGDPTDRRYYSQTNSCRACGITLRLTAADGAEATAPLETAVAWLLAGKILAVKGIGGYLLLCDATDAVALRTLRARKHRPTKPFALLYADAAQLAGDVFLHTDDLELLNSPAAPIVLLPRRPAPASGLDFPGVAPGLDLLGVMLPYAPLPDLLARGAGRPLVATSGNISGSPIIYDDETARRELTRIADGILSHNRAIAIPQDDSVLRFSPEHRQPIVLRRSRGYAPTFLPQVPPTSNFIPRPRDRTSNLEPSPEYSGQTFEPSPEYSGQTLEPSNSILALGATLKSTFAWQHQGNLYLSQYLGDLESFDTQEAFEHTLRHFTHLLRAHPQALVVDKHPDYFSTQLGRRLAAEWDVPLTEVQHHKAHFTAVLAENGYFLSGGQLEKPVLGVIWDGTGYGDDGQVWGGEFFRFDGRAIERAGHFEPFDFILGDKMPREPRISALSLAFSLEHGPALLEPKFSKQEWDLYGKMLGQGSLLKTTSVGRLFDAVASLLGLADRVSYEGEAALLLEQAAARYFRRHGLRNLAPFLPDPGLGTTAPTRAIVGQVMADLLEGMALGKIAARFHAMLIGAIRQQARRLECPVLAFSGGVWQNALLVDLALEWLRPEFELLLHRQLPPNDEGVSFGQVMVFYPTKFSQITRMPYATQSSEDTSVSPT